MKIRIISDIILEPLAKELNILSEDLTLNLDFVENIADRLILESSSITEEIIYIHMDNFFKKNSEDKLLDTLSAINDFATKTKSLVVLSNAYITPYTIGAMNETPGVFLSFGQRNKKIFSMIMSHTNIYSFDFLKTISAVGLKNAYNFNLGHLYQMPYTKSLISEFAFDLSNYIKRLQIPDKKVIVLDCDNTLWGGIVGEDGINHIRCDLNSEGIIYYQFQQFLLQKKKEGFLLALCSKNNEQDVKDLFDKKSFPLNWKDFIIKKINWQDKYKNIYAIAKELNLGLDSFIYIDDSDFEINSIKKLIPEVVCLQFENDYKSFLKLIENLLFYKKVITADDIKKTQQYELEELRNQEIAVAGSIEEYVKSLEIKLDIKINNLNEIERLAQLTEKTNQFNFNKIPYSIPILKRKVMDGSFRLYSLRVTDKYGDYGTVGLIIIEFKQNQTILENFIMSCRALGRMIEHDFYQFVRKDLAKDNLEITQVRFKTTAKNKPAENFYELIKNEKHAK